MFGWHLANKLLYDKHACHITQCMIIGIVGIGIETVTAGC